ncbi:MAG: VanW family protein [Solobacterium sp.]|nr:VanW family protein [Solobacterium sp.]
MAEKKRKLFCEISPLTYEISMKKEIIKRHIKNLTSKEKIAREHSNNRLPYVVSSNSSQLIKKGKGIDPVLQYNKADNIALANAKISGILIKPGETFSLWQTVGKPTRRKGYKDGRVIEGNHLVAGLGGGLCNLGNTIHLLVLDTPMDVTEFHKHSDALAPDHGHRVPLGAGTSVCYNMLDFCCKNNTDQTFQILLWCESEVFYGEMRTDKELPYTYRITEDDHHFHKEGDKYYRISKIYRETLDKKTGEIVERKLIWDNHSEVLFDYSQIPQDQIR